MAPARDIGYFRRPWKGRRAQKQSSKRTLALVGAERDNCLEVPPHQQQVKPGDGKRPHVDPVAACFLDVATCSNSKHNWLAIHRRLGRRYAKRMPNPCGSPNCNLAKGTQTTYAQHVFTQAHKHGLQHDSQQRTRRTIIPHSRHMLPPSEKVIRGGNNRELFDGIPDAGRDQDNAGLCP